MRNSIKTFSVIFLVVLFSCRSSKDLIFLKDVANNEINSGLPAEYILKTGDILYVSIKSMNPEVNLLYNPESNMENNMGQGYMKYTTPSGAYLYGFEVDQEENVKLPMLGKIKVSGIPLSQIESVVQKKADEFLKDAIVKVKLLNFKITVSGEVRNPGDYYNYNNSNHCFRSLSFGQRKYGFRNHKKSNGVETKPRRQKNIYARPEFQKCISLRCILLAAK